MEVFIQKKIRLEDDDIVCLRNAARILEELEEETNGENDWELPDISEILQEITYKGEWEVVN